MRSLSGMIIGFVVGVLLAGGAAFGVVQVTKQTPSNTNAVDKPLFSYGSR